MSISKVKYLLIAGFLFLELNYSQQNSYSSNEIFQSLKKLNVLGSVLYIAAHPDDENTSVLSYMSKGELTRTAYLSLTRGDGGQNLLGNEKGDLLGVIRTEELLSARSIDGAEQYFTGAIDFGYSKSTEETLKHWDKKLLLYEVVKIIRQFKPDIILTRFSKTQGGHGHHLVSAIIAEEAFYAAADPENFPEQLNDLDTWQTKRLYWNTWQPSNNAISIDIGEYNSVLGRSYSEISALSRSMHKSQGFGSVPSRGSQLVHFDYIAGDKAKNNLFDGIDITWNRVKDGNVIEAKINNTIKKFDQDFPEQIIQDLVDIYKMLNNINDPYWAELKKREVKELIKKCTGLWMEAIVPESEISPGESSDIITKIINRSEIPIILEDVITSFSNSDYNVNQKLNYNEPIIFNHKLTIPINHNYTQPFWLKENHDGYWFSIKDENFIGLVKNSPDITTKFKVNVLGETFIYEVPVIHRWADAVQGELTKPFIIIPKIGLSVDQNSLVFPNGKKHKVKVTLIAKTDSAHGKIYIDLPSGWTSDNSSYNFNIDIKENQQSFVFEIIPNENAKSGKAKIAAEMNGKIYSNEIVEIDYPHIEYQTVLKPVILNLVKLDINIEQKKIGYIMGSGDEIPNSLSQINYQVDLLSDQDLDNRDLSEFDVIICGVRAFNTRPDLARKQNKLIDFVKNGGTWIVQHNTRFGFQTEQIGPYKFSTTGRDRISEEDAQIKILKPEHKIFNYPNKITGNDFKGWIQERGLYFANNWDDNLYPLLSGNDTGESPKLGGLLHSYYGEGVFIFTAYSWFRQLPAGVPGAYRLFVNMISAKGKNEK